MKKYLKGLKNFLINILNIILGIFGKKIKTEEEKEKEKICNPYEKHMEIKDEGGAYMKNTDLYSLIRNKLNDKISANTYFYLIDSEYYLPSKEYVKKVLDVDKTDTRKYRAQTYDCDDFSYTLNSTFIELTYKDNIRRAPFSFGIVMGNLPNPHAINIFVDDKKEIYFIEPQSDIFIKFDSENIKSIYNLIM